MSRAERLGTGIAAALLAFLGLFPLANWIPGGHAAPWYGPVAADLLTGLAIAAGTGLVLAILSRRIPWLWRDGLLDPVCSAAGRHGARWTAGVALLGLGAYVWAARSVLGGRPLLIDEIIQVFQARLLAAGRLWTPAAPYQEFFSSLHLVEQAGRVYGQFPIGGPAMLAVGTLAGAEWLVNPVFATLAVLAFGALVRRIEPRSGVALGATALFALAPFAVFMAGSYMNHLTTLAWLVFAMLGLAKAVDDDQGRLRDGVLAGFALGVAACIRPVDALAFALPAGGWLLWRAIRRGRLTPLLGAGAGIALPLLALAWANLETTGGALRFGYTVLWGHAHDLGFHATPWGAAHTPLRGLELVNLYFLRLQTYLFEAAGPSLLPATAALALTPRLRPFDRYLLVSGALLVGGYFAYWHDGFYLGPRFVYPLLPLLALWTARLPSALRERAGAGLVYRAAVWTLVIGGALGLATSLPIRARQYRGGMISLRRDPERAAREAGVSGALVFVRESWGAELVARMWALGVPRPEADAYYRAADPCRLDSALTTLERDGVRGTGAVAALAPLQGDSIRLVQATDLTGDPSLRLTPGVPYPPRCIAKIQANNSGFTLFPPLLLARGDNVYARDLGARDSLLIAAYPGRPLYLLKPESGAVGAVPVFHPLRADSLLAAWRGGR